MGGLCSKRQEAPNFSSFVNELEEIQQEIDEISERKARAHSRHQLIIRTLILYSFMAWIILGVGAYFYEPGPNMVLKVARIVPALFFPFLVYLIKSAIDIYYGRKLDTAEQELIELKEQKNAKLQEFVQRSGFLEMQGVLAKFTGVQPKTPAKPLQPAQQGQAQGQPARPSISTSSTPAESPRASPPPSLSPANSQAATNIPPTPLYPVVVGTAQPPPVYAPAERPFQPLMHDVEQKIAPRNNVDRMFDFILGDGPNNRYALICEKCFTHNGLAKEESKSTRFRCAYCGYFNGPELNQEDSAKIGQARMANLARRQQEQNQQMWLQQAASRPKPGASGPIAASSSSSSSTALLSGEQKSEQSEQQNSERKPEQNTSDTDEDKQADPAQVRLRKQK